MSGCRMLFNSTSLMRRGLLTTVLVLTGVTSLACTAGNSAPPPQEYTELAYAPSYFHTVKYSGETLSLISRWYTGKASNWRLVLDANPGLRPERINLGDEIVIPGELLVTKDPLPKSLLTRAKSTKEPEQQNNQIIGGSPQPADNAIEPVAEQEEPSVDELLNELAEPREVEAEAPEVAVEADPTPAFSVEADESALTMPIADAPQEGTQEGTLVQQEAQAPLNPAQNRELTSEDAERERLLDELLSQ